MKIIDFRAVNLNEYITFRLTFHSDLTFLTGINGSGKTSAVRAMTALLAPSLEVLSALQFDEIAVSVEHKEEERTVSSERSGKEIILRYSGVDDPLIVPILRKDPYESRAAFLSRRRNFYREQEAVQQDNPALSAIAKLPTPMFLDLERRYRDGGGQKTALPPRRVSTNPLAGPIAASIAEAQALAEMTYRNFLAEKSELTDALKENIILTAFRPDDHLESKSWLPEPSGVKKIDENEALVRQSLGTLISKDRFEETVEPFFTRARSVIQKFRKLRSTNKKLDFSEKDVMQTVQEWSAILPQVRQTERLAELLAAYNEAVGRAYSPIERYLYLINRFLNDSKKSISFNASANLEIVSSADEPRRIEGLSSGESQLFVILTQLALNSNTKTAKILIIDEPELSLHIRWQELFVDAVVEASPDLQVILATHSPSIILDRIANCIDVQEARDSANVRS
jgi:predicted ATP-dependent endonuclease of OLD family